MTKFQKGMKGQLEAENFLRSKNYRIIERNYRIRTGEIDLIAEDNGYVVFIEVKYRKGLDLGFPAESVTYYKQQKIIKTALFYIANKKLINRDYRFDVLEVLEMDEITINHIENAFWA